jgi:hypothetical protein
VQTSVQTSGEAVASTRNKNLTAIINHTRRKTNIFEPDPEFRQDIQLPFKILTKKGQQFLWEDTGVDDANRILIFSKTHEQSFNRFCTISVF